MPVFVNEPCSVLQKGAEFITFLALGAHTALNESNSTRRCAYVSALALATFNAAIGRTSKPFNPMLGETYEFVSTKMRFVSEQVSHHPPCTAFYAQGDNWEVYRVSQSSQRFNGKTISITEEKPYTLKLRLRQDDGSYQIEEYQWISP